MLDGYYLTRCNFNGFIDYPKTAACIFDKPAYSTVAFPWDPYFRALRELDIDPSWLPSEYNYGESYGCFAWSIHSHEIKSHQGYKW